MTRFSPWMSLVRNGAAVLSDAALLVGVIAKAIDRVIQLMPRLDLPPRPAARRR